MISLRPSYMLPMNSGDWQAVQNTHGRSEVNPHRKSNEH